MSHKAVTLDLDPANLLWLEDQAGAPGRRTLSEVVNELLAKIRGSQRGERGSVPSVRGMIEIAEDDPNLEEADAALRTLFAESFERQPG